MTTKKRRINVSIPKPLEEALEKLARRDQVPEAMKAAELLQIAIEFDEDQVWDSIALSRDNKKAKFVPHKKAWA